MSRPIADLAARFPDIEWGSSHGQDVVRIDRTFLPEFVEGAREVGFDTFVDLCVVDYLDRPEGRYEIAVMLLALSGPQRVRILAAVPGDDPTVPSITGSFPGANWYEREAYDLFGITFDGHPDLTRILLPDDWSGHPLRKDSPIGSVPVQFKHPDEGTT